MDRLAQYFTEKIELALNRERLQAKVSVEGSYARDTWLSGEADLDIFARFPPTISREEWITNILPKLRRELRDYNIIERYAEHPFLEFHVEGVRINIVPAYEVKLGKWRSATDRSAYHTEYMKKHLTTELRLQSRFLRKFMKGIRVYGAEIKIGGFSGMLAETLIVYYGSFLGVLEHAAQWSHRTVIQIENMQGKKSSSEPRHLLAEKTDAALVVIDPIDPNRNLAAAVRPSKLWTFVEASREFLRLPGLWYFYPPSFKSKTRPQFTKKIQNTQSVIHGIWFQHPVMVVDVLWGQLMRLERSFVRTLARNDFQVRRSEIWSDEQTQSAIILELGNDLLPPVVRRIGPPISNKNGSEAFLRRHLSATDTARGPWVQDDHWTVDKYRRLFRLQDLIAIMIRDQSYGLIVPSELKKTFSKTWKLRTSKELVAETRRKDFNQAFWEFLEAKPSWLKPIPE